MGKEKRGKNIHSREAPFSKSTGDQERKTMTMGKRQNPEEAISFQPTWLAPLNCWWYKLFQTDSWPLLRRVLVTVSLTPALSLNKIHVSEQKKQNRILFCKTVMYCWCL